MTMPMKGTMRRPVALGLGAAGIATAVMAVMAVVAPAELWRGDPGLYRVVATAPFSDGAALRAHAAVMGNAYRYGRVGAPLLAWVLALGHPAWTPLTFRLVCAGGVGATIAVVAAWFTDRGVGARRAVLALLIPGVAIGFARPFPDMLMVALLLAALLCWPDRPWLAAALLGYAILVRETAALTLVPLAFDALRRRRLPVIVAAAVPYAAWATWVRIRVGAFPLLEHSVSRSQALGFTPLSFVDLVHRAPVIAVPAVVAVVAAMGTLSLAVRACLRAPGLLTGTAAAHACLLLGLGVTALWFPDDTWRVMGPAMVLTMLAVVSTMGVPAPPDLTAALSPAAP